MKNVCMTIDQCKLSDWEINEVYTIITKRRYLSGKLWNWFPVQIKCNIWLPGCLRITY